MDLAPARPWVPKEHTYLDAYKRRMYKPYYMKPKFDISEARGFMETFETHEPQFRPIRKYINPENGYETPWKSCRGSGQFDIQSRVIHVGKNGSIVTPSGEWWKKGKRYLIPTSGSWSEPAFKPSLRYIRASLSDDQIWRPCIRVYRVARPHYFNSRPIRRRYLPQQPGYDDKYERLTSNDAYSGIYHPRKITSIKPEWLGFSNNGVPYRKSLTKKVTDYFHKHPQLQLFSADFRPELTRSHPSYVSTTRYNAGGRYDHFEDRSFTIQPDVRLPEPLGAQPVPDHSPPYSEVKPMPSLAGDIVGIDIFEAKPTRLMSPRLSQKPSVTLSSNEGTNQKHQEKRPQSVLNTQEGIQKKKGMEQVLGPERSLKIYDRVYEVFQAEPEKAKASLQPWTA
ncbi:hypothetical protein SELMODRAFT_431110 [Selaginella moellendorffii]|uniref:Uncharacterized protein n=1 Tax=Selaginella moellendorffii TaxID=88036 RepID=D8TBJ7_SELML|nr:hypothetical protein SELMODRAFT_431110 [Selaginella moellendorffii]